MLTPAFQTYRSTSKRKGRWFQVPDARVIITTFNYTSILPNLLRR